MTSLNGRYVTSTGELWFLCLGANPSLPFLPSPPLALDVGPLPSFLPLRSMYK